ncbi:MAG TPA: CDP-alcohol phosphatidyltransferase family protein [Pirellula sp.]|nr:CDP-alcohol phosphatidyltransferase family protein [Pirellula sp.]
MKSNDTQADRDDSPMRDRILTIPNLICFFRLGGALSLIYFAITNKTLVFVAVFIALSLSDWIDGRLARWLNQRTNFGARLDSFADSILYGSLLFGMIWMRWEVLQHEAIWWITGLCSYALTTGAGLWKYGRIPSYHTNGAKISQWFILLGAVSLLLDYSTWPFRIAILAGTITNLEATAITWILPEWRADVLSIAHAGTIVRSGNDGPHLSHFDRL